MEEMVDIISPIINFLESCPYFNQAGFQVGELRFVNSVSEAQALQYTGTPQPTPHKDIYGNVWLEKQANFMLFLSRRKDDKIKSTMISNLLYNLEVWVERQNFIGSPPRIGDEPLNERIWADNGRWYSGSTDKSIDIYQVQVHIKYIKKYNVDEVSA